MPRPEDVARAQHHIAPIRAQLVNIQGLRPVEGSPLGDIEAFQALEAEIIGDRSSYERDLDIVTLMERRALLSPADRFADELIESYNDVLAGDANTRSDRVAQVITNATHELYRGRFDQIGSVVSYLVAHEPQEEQTRSQLHQRLARRLISEVRKEGINMREDRLSHMIRWYTHNSLARPVATQMLHAYFESPEPQARKTNEFNRMNEERKKIAWNLIYFNFLDKRRDISPASVDTLPDFLVSRTGNMLTDVDGVKMLDLRNQDMHIVIPATGLKEVITGKVLVHIPDATISDFISSHKDGLPEVSSIDTLDLRRKRLDLLKKFVMAGLSLSDDQEALVHMAKIVLGKDPNIFSVDSEFFTNVFVGSSYPLECFTESSEFNDGDFENRQFIPTVNRRHLSVSNYGDYFNVARVATTILEVLDTPNTNETNYPAIYARMMDFRYQGWSRDQVLNAMNYVAWSYGQDSSYKAITVSTHTERAAQEPLYGARVRGADPLRIRYIQSFEPDFRVYEWRSMMTDRYGDNFLEVTIPIIKGDLRYAIHATFPAERRSDLRKIIPAIEQDIIKREQELLKPGDELIQYDKYRGIGLSGVISGFDYDGTYIEYIYHETTVLEGQRHEIAALEQIGFPPIPTTLSRPIEQINRELAEQLSYNMLYFLPTTGYRVPLQDTPLEEYGYTHVDFLQDDVDPAITVARFVVGSLSYEIRMDENYQLMFEGKRAPSNDFIQSLKYVMYSYLYNLLCVPEEDIEVLHEPSGRRSIEAKTRPAGIKRKGHLRKLSTYDTDEGKKQMHHTPRARKLCFDVTRRDLDRINAIREELSLIPVTWESAVRRGEENDSETQEVEITNLQTPELLS